MKSGIPVLLLVWSSLLAVSAAAGANPVTDLLETSKPALDLDGDGRIDFRRSFDAKGLVVAWDRDRNHDGRPDELMERTEFGQVTFHRDQDFDGQMDEVLVQQFDGTRLLTELLKQGSRTIERTYDQVRGVMVEVDSRDGVRKIEIRERR